MRRGVVVEDLQDAEGGAEGEAEDGEDAQGAADLLAFLGLYESAVVSCFSEDFVEACGQPALVLEGEEQIVGRAVCGEVLSPVGAAEEGDVPLQRGDAVCQPGGVEHFGEFVGELVDVIALERAEEQGVKIDGTQVHRAAFEEVVGTKVGPVAGRRPPAAAPGAPPV